MRAGDARRNDLKKKKKKKKNVHEKTGFTAGTVTDDDELTTKFGHLVDE